MENKSALALVTIVILSVFFYLYPRAMSTQQYAEGLVRVRTLYSTLQKATSTELNDPVKRKEFYDEYQTLENMFGENFKQSDFFDLQIKVQELGLDKPLIAKTEVMELPPPLVVPKDVEPEKVGVVPPPADLPPPLIVPERPNVVLPPTDLPPALMTFEDARNQVDELLDKGTDTVDIQNFIDNTSMSADDKTKLQEYFVDKSGIGEKQEESEENIGDNLNKFEKDLIKSIEEFGDIGDYGV